MRAKNPRRELLGWLRLINRSTGNLVAVWDVPGYVWEQGQPERRKRSASEYPENQAERWRQAALQLEEMADALDRMVVYCAQQESEARDREGAS